MNSVIGHGIISAILCTVVEENIPKFIFGCCAMLLGALGTGMEIADRIKREKGVSNGDDIPGPSR